MIVPTMFRKSSKILLIFLVVLTFVDRWGPINYHSSSVVLKSSTPRVVVDAAATSSNNNSRRQRQNKNAVDDSSTVNDGDDDPNIHFLVEWIGKEIYSVVKKPKYKFYIYMTIGKLPNEHDTILVISTICNIVYGTSVLIGFILFPRGIMLFITLATLWIGPALVLVILGTIGGLIGAFALYPITSVALMCLYVFLTSQLAQTIGTRLGLDSDGDGDVDWLDLLHYVAKTNLGSKIGLQKLHDILNQANQDPFQVIHHRLNVIDQNTSIMSSIRRDPSGEVEDDGLVLSVTPEKKAI